MINVFPLSAVNSWFESKSGQTINKTKEISRYRDSSKFQSKIRINRGDIDTRNIHIHDHTLSYLGTGTSIKSGGAMQVLWAHWNDAIMQVFSTCE